MLFPMRHRGKIVNGRFAPDNKRKWELEQELLNGRSVTVELKVETPPSMSENLDSYYFGYLIGEVASSLEEFADCYSRIQVHEKLMEAITGSYVAVKDNMLRATRDSYSNYNYSQRVTYVEKVKAFLTIECGVTLND